MNTSTRSSFRWFVLTLCLSSCDGNAEPDESMTIPTAESPNESAASRTATDRADEAASAEAVDTATEQGAAASAPGPEAPSEVDGGAPEQARIFGFGTSCSPNPCRNGGSCVDQWLGYTCRCAAGFTGTNCQTSTGSGARCGDGIVQSPEQCDDGNTSSSDACVNCRTAGCGDGIVWAGVEQCDDGNSNRSDSCVNCRVAVCGDGSVRAGLEECERNVGGWSSATCRVDCTRTNYRTCRLNTECAAGEHCGVIGGVCSSPCSPGRGCASVPGYSAICTATGMCAILCGAQGTCPSGLRCGLDGTCVQNPSCCNSELGCEGCFWPSGN